MKDIMTTNKGYFVRTSESAVLPTKAHPSDSGFDLTLISAVKSFGDVALYGTGIKVKPPEGYYFDVVPRSSVSKTGYMLANSVGIIDQSYTGEILVALRKVDKTAPDLELPVRMAQLILRPMIPVDMEEVAELPTSERGDGGFGSTGK